VIKISHWQTVSFLFSRFSDLENIWASKELHCRYENLPDESKPFFAGENSGKTSNLFIVNLKRYMYNIQYMFYPNIYSFELKKTNKVSFCYNLFLLCYINIFTPFYLRWIAFLCKFRESCFPKKWHWPLQVSNCWQTRILPA